MGVGLAACSAALHVRRGAPDAAVTLWLAADGPEPSGPGTDDPAPGVPMPPGVAFAAPSPDLVAAHADRGDERLAAEVRLARVGLDLLEREVIDGALNCGFRRLRVTRDLVPSDAERRREHDALARRFDVADDAVFDGAALVRGLRSRAESSGVRVASVTELSSLVADTAGERVEVTLAGLCASAARLVLATEAHLARFDDWTRALSIPARAQALALVPDGDAAVPAEIVPRSHGPGFAVAASDLEGRLLVAEGIEPSNRGDPFDPAPNPAVSSRLEEWARDVVLPGRPLRVVGRGARPRLYTCDGLPLVGPHPGRASCLLAAGFGGREWTDGFVAGRVVGEIVTEGRTTVAGAALWSPRRML